MNVFDLLHIIHVYASQSVPPMKHAKCVGKIRVLVQTKMHECSSRKPKCMSKVYAARALFMQTMMHTAAD